MRRAFGTAQHPNKPLEALGVPVSHITKLRDGSIPRLIKSKLRQGADIPSSQSHG
jgi:hypothetical protein